MAPRGGPAFAAAHALAPLAAFLALVALVDYADWGEGPTRAAALGLAAAALAWAWARPPPERDVPAWLAAAAAVALLRFAAATANAPPPQPNDIGWTTARAVDAIRAGRSPYAARVDPQRDLPREGTGLDWLMGYKYGPLMPRYYAPFLRAFGVPRGLAAGNAVVLAVAVLVAALLARRVAGTGAALAAVTGLLWPQLVRHELFYIAVNDLVPTALVLVALWAASGGRGAARSLLAGVATGLSMAAKPLPGALLLLLLPGTVKALPLAAGVALGLLSYLPDLVATPRELLANLVLFNLERPGDSTGAAAGLARWLNWLPGAVAAALVAATVIRYHRGRRAPADLVMAAALLTTLFLAGGKLIHRNYLLWWLPLASAALGVAWYRGGASPAPDRPP